MVYFSRIWQQACHLRSLPFRLDKWLFWLPQGWTISFGFWIRYTVDNPGVPPSTFSSGGYLYSPLRTGQIRLLKIQAGNHGDVVKTSLVTVDLRDAPPYEALSYVWGSFAESSSLVIDGQPVRIHTGLFNAIHALRCPASERLVWADAICINQSHMAERGHQVSIMGQIYETAKSVAIYLGHSNERTAEGMRALSFFTKRTVAGEEPPWSHTALPELEESLADILTRPWFKRIWTVQEATLARHTTLICGEHQVAWSGDLRTMRSIVFRIKAAIISPHFSLTNGYTSTLDWLPLLSVLETQMRQAARREGVVHFRNHLDVAFAFRDRQATDPRDKYFAIFGIIENDQQGRLNLQPDYTMTLEELHRRFTAEIQRISEVEDDRKFDATS